MSSPQNKRLTERGILQKMFCNLPTNVEDLAEKVKSPYRMAERETAAYAVVNRIDY